MKKSFYFILMVFLMAGCKTTQENVPSREEIVRPLVAQKPFREILATETSFNLETGEIEYTLPEAALVRLRIGRDQGGALLRTIADWDPRPAGKNKETWNKKDETGKIDFSAFKDVIVMMSCIPLDAAKFYPIPTPVRGFKKSPRFEVMFPESNQEKDGVGPMVQGTVPIRILVSEEDIAWLTKSKFEIVIYVDQIFLIEGESGVNPFNYQLNTEGFNEGIHTLTINVASFNGEIGTQSVNFYVKKWGQ